MTIHIKDIYEVRPEKRYADLSQRERTKLMDSVLNQQDETKRGLLVDFNLSNSGRVINRRLYMPQAQQRAAANLAEKPIIKNHDSNDVDNIIGRFVGGRWNPLDEQALQFFHNMADYMSVKRAFDSNDPKRIHRELSKHGLLTNDQWLGLGEIEAQARITDEKAVEKFLKGEYLHFSAGATTDRWACGLCAQDWHAEGPCEHMPGKTYKDGLAIIVTGAYDVAEGSLVVTPGNDQSRVRSMRMTDSAGKELDFADEVVAFDDSTIYVTDALITGVEEEMPKIEDLVAQLLPVLLEKLKAELPSKATDQTQETEQKVEDTGTEEENATVQDTGTGDNKQPDQVQDQLVIPWTLLDRALRGETLVALNAEQIAALDSKYILGPDNKFIVHDAAAVAAARVVLKDFDQKVQDAIEPKLADIEQSFVVVVDVAEHQKLVDDYAVALRQIQDLRTELDEAKNRIAELDKAKATDQNVDETAKTRTEDVKRVEGDNLASSEDTDRKPKLNDFEQRQVNRYKEILQTQGKDAAKNFLDAKIRKRHLPRTFDITQYLEEN